MFKTNKKAFIKSSTTDISTVRSYQQSIVESAKNSNIIAVLHTGTGKTLISLILINHVSKEANERFKAGLSPKRKLCVFLVPAIPLVSQQSDYIKFNCNLRVTSIRGALGVDKWGALNWKSTFDTSDVIVVTPQILLNGLHSAFFTLDQFSLLVFDECHHARGLHPYGQIMELYRTFDGEKPKIFGMTASPSNNKVDASDSIKMLESSMMCRAITVAQEDLEELSRFMPRPAEEVIFHPQGPFFDIPANFGKFVEAGAYRCEAATKWLDDALEVSDQYGTWWGDRCLELAYKQLVTRAGSSNRNRRQPPAMEIVEPEELEEGEVEPDEKKYDMPVQTFIQNLKSLLATKVSLPKRKGKRKFAEFASESRSQPSSASRLVESQMSPKLQSLVKVLMNYAEHENFCGIVFVERRTTAHILMMALKAVKDLSFLKIGVLVGHGSSGSGNIGSMAASQQEIVVRKFREGSLNLLIATKIGEEGLDIQPCMLVIRLSMFRTLINYIQSRGRARHESSRYVMIMEEDDTASYKQYLDIQFQEKKMTQLLNNPKAEDEEDLEEIKLLSDDCVFISPVTGARVDIISATSLLYRYCSLLPRDKFCNSIPETSFETNDRGEISAKLFLPMNAPSSCRIVTGPFLNGKKNAKRMAAFKAVIQLYEQGELNERFRPIHIKMDKSGNIMAKVVQIGMVRVRDCHIGVADSLQGSWEDVSEFHFSSIEIVLQHELSEKVSSDFGLEGGKKFVVGIITCLPIVEDGTNSFIYDLPVRGENGAVSVKLVSSSKPIKVSKKNLEKMREYHASAYAAFLRRHADPEFDWAYLIVPIKWDERDPNKFELDYPSIDQCHRWTVFKSRIDCITFKSQMDEYKAEIEKFSDQIKEQSALEKRKAEIEKIKLESATLGVEVDIPDTPIESATVKKSRNQMKKDGDLLVVLPSFKDLEANNSIQDQVPIPEFKHPYEGSLLQVLCEKLESDDWLKENCLVVDNYYYERKYVILDILRDFKPTDDIPEKYTEDATAKKALGGFPTIASFYKSRLRCWEDINPDQPIIMAIQIPQLSQLRRLKAKYTSVECKRNDLEYPGIRNNKPNPIVYLLPQFCFIFPIYKDIIQKYLCHLPLITRQLEHALLVRDYRKTLEVEYIPLVDLQVALTAPSAHQPYDYERLENYGDSFLKLLITLHIFAKNPDHHEGRLTSERNLLEGNKLFTTQAMKTGIAQAILSESLTRILWLPLHRQPAKLLENSFVDAETESKEGEDEGDESEEGVKKEEDADSVVIEEPEISETSTKDVNGSVNDDSIESSSSKEPLAASPMSIDKELQSPNPIEEPLEIPELKSSEEEMLLNIDEEEDVVLIPRKISSQERILSDKTIADCIEAIIGAVVFSPDGGLKEGSKVAAKLLDNEYETDWKSGYGKMFEEAGYYNRPPEDYAKFNDTIAEVEQVIGYKFRNPNLLVEAMTHPSAISYDFNSGCYQRLEFLGDAVLHWTVTDYVYRRYPLLSPGTISEYRSNLVCNQFLACVSQRIGLPKYLNHFSDIVTPLTSFCSELEKNLEIYSNRFGDPEGPLIVTPLVYGNDEKITDKVSSNPFWVEMTTAPKAIADIYESLIGAVFVDCIDVELAAKVIHRTLLNPWLPIVGPPNAMISHPVAELTEIALKELECKRMKMNTLFNEFDASNTCTILFHDTVIGESISDSSKTCQKLACAKAVKHIKANFTSVRKLCDCKAVVVEDKRVDVFDEEIEIDGRVGFLSKKKQKEMSEKKGGERRVGIKREKKVICLGDDDEVEDED